MVNKKPMTAHLDRRTMLLSSSVGALGVLIGTSSPTLAATRPSAQWGTFTQTDTRAYCQQLAAAALQYIGCPIAASDAYLTTGYNDQVFVSVTSVPLDTDRTYIIVIAASDDNNVAEQARNDVRTFIQTHTCTDPNEDCGISISN